MDEDRLTAERCYRERAEEIRVIAGTMTTRKRGPKYNTEVHIETGNHP